MASGHKSGKHRVDPSFGDEDEDDGFQVEAEERISGPASRRAQRRTTEPEPREAREPRSRRKRREERSSGGFFGFIRSMIYWSIVLGIWVGIGIGGLVLYYGARMPNASTWSIPERPPNVKITALDGSLLANRGATGGEALALEEMSPYIPQAVVAIEDRRFYSHFGIDPLGLARAFVNNLTGRSIQGGSTLTQQLAKNLFLSPDRTFERKVQEVLLSFWLERKFTKDQILTMYLNRMFFGSNAYGVEAASRRYFNKSAKDVNLREAAILAGVLKAPTKLSPARDPQAAETRAQLVLGAMRESGFISDQEAMTAMSQPPTKARSYWTGAQHYAADMVMDEVKSLIGEVKTDVTVQTTLDLRLEKEAEKALFDVLKSEGAKQNASQAALVSVDATGAIRAVVGGKDYAESQFNRAAKAKRQPGSAFKPFVYAAALEAGYRPDTVLNDGPVKIGNWTPENFDQKYRGPVTLATALAHSLNTIAAQLVMQVGPNNVITLAHRLGIESDLQANASIALGTSEVTLVELTSAYAAFMNGGFKATPHLVTRIIDANGKVLYDADFSNPPRVLNETIVATMNNMMSHVLTEGTGRAARLADWQAAGKSGTTQSFRDALFVGFTSTLTTGVWFGNDDGTSMKKVTGGGLPAKAWKNYMTTALKGYKPTPLYGVGLPVAPPAANDPVLLSQQPAQPQPQLQPQQQPGAPGQLLSGTQPARDPRSYPAAPTPAEESAAVAEEGGYIAPPSQIPAQIPARDYRDYRTYRGPTDAPIPPGDVGGGPVPPADVGGGSQRGHSRQTTLLDIIMGQ